MIKIIVIIILSIILLILLDNTFKNQEQYENMNNSITIDRSNYWKYFNKIFVANGDVTMNLSYDMIKFITYVRPMKDIFINLTYPNNDSRTINLSKIDSSFHDSPSDSETCMNFKGTYKLFYSDTIPMIITETQISSEQEIPNQIDVSQISTFDYQNYSNGISNSNVNLTINTDVPTPFVDPFNMILYYSNNNDGKIIVYDKHIVIPPENQNVTLLSDKNIEETIISKIQIKGGEENSKYNSYQIYFDPFLVQKIE